MRRKLLNSHKQLRGFYYFDPLWNLTFFCRLESLWNDAKKRKRKKKMLLNPYGFGLSFEKDKN
jgi:hypothetical protein